MSLINQMLQDLDARQATPGSGTPWSNAVRPLPAPRSSRRAVISGAIVLLVVAGGLALYRPEAGPRPSPPPPVVAIPVTPAVDPSTVPSSMSEPASPAALGPWPPLEASVPDQPSPVADHAAPAAEPVALPVAGKLVNPPLKAAAVVGKPVAADLKLARSGQLQPVIESRLPPSPAIAQADQPARAGSIEKKEVPASPRERAEGDYRKAIGAVNQGRVEEAMEGLRAALRQNGLHVAARQLLVNLLLEAKRPDESIRLLHEGLSAQPAQIGWSMTLARLQVDRGDLLGASQTLHSSAEAATANAEYQGFTAHVLQRLGHHREAAEHFQAAARLSPGDGRWWLGLGLSLEAEGQAGEAREAYLRARQSGNMSSALATLVEQKLR